MSVRRVFICSPYRANGPDAVRRNVEAAEMACRLALEAGFAPFAPHLLYTRFLNEGDEREREAGIVAGVAWMAGCHELWAVYPGEVWCATEGMRREIEEAFRFGIPVRPLRLSDGRLIAGFGEFKVGREEDVGGGA